MTEAVTEPATEPVIDRRPERGLLIRWRDRLGGIVLVSATLLIGHLFIEATPDRDSGERPYLRSGTIGEVLDGRTFDATVVGMRGATQLSGSPFVHDTQGVWVIVRFRVVPRDEPVRLGYAVLVDEDERWFRATDRITQPLLGQELQPGIPVEGEIAFEVPKDSKHLAVRLTEETFDIRMSAIVEVPLPIGDLNTWSLAKEPVKLEKATVVS
ncbi:hypothetical protein F4553_003982 [Allocatelliglobosispora scoriae]|uniref:DUF4352 domain-containing protein n=1 Tax=Allocatelliglobosispora scoriae TaxID=643052 RepID=A0A841BUL2_9ACTN|nr:hypothetical protein [Allocatelliglobosispora scoriae]MBB5870603.1 hypothetical protein [Allocatelliglobosispora scoriae]